MERREQERKERRGASDQQMTYGPIETEEIERLLQERRDAERQELRTILMDQVKEKRRKTLDEQVPPEID